MLRKHKSVSLDCNIFTYFECGLTWINYADLGRKFSVKLKNIVIASRLLWEFQKIYFKNVVFTYFQVILQLKTYFQVILQLKTYFQVIPQLKTYFQVILQLKTVMPDLYICTNKTLEGWHWLKMLILGSSNPC